MGATSSITDEPVIRGGGTLNLDSLPVELHGSIGKKLNLADIERMRGTSHSLRDAWKYPYDKAVQYNFDLQQIRQKLELLFSWRLKDDFETRNIIHQSLSEPYLKFKQAARIFWQIKSNEINNNEDENVDELMFTDAPEIINEYLNWFNTVLNTEPTLVFRRQQIKNFATFLIQFIEVFHPIFEDDVISGWLSFWVQNMEENEPQNARYYDALLRVVKEEELIMDWGNEFYQGGGKPLQKSRKGRKSNKRKKRSSFKKSRSGKTHKSRASKPRKH